MPGESSPGLGGTWKVLELCCGCRLNASSSELPLPLLPCGVRGRFQEPEDSSHLPNKRRTRGSLMHDDLRSFQAACLCQREDCPHFLPSEAPERMRLRKLWVRSQQLIFSASS